MQQGIFDLLLTGKESEERGTFCRKENWVGVSCLTFLGDFAGIFSYS